jgi:hypothetical protein
MYSPFNTNNLEEIATQQIAIVHPTAEELPRSSQGYAANNIYPGFPPLMSDGRALIASWQPEAVANQSLLKSSGVASNWEYRNYLTQNAAAIMKQNFVETATDAGYYDVQGMGVKNGFVPFFSTAGKPAQYASFMQPPNAFGNFASDLKADYLSREQLTARMATPVVSQDELLKLQKQTRQ